MHVLVVATPQFPVPPDAMPGLAEAATDWHERHKGEMEAFGLFPGGGGFGVVDVASDEALNQLMLEMPFAPFSSHEIRPFVPGEAGLRQLRDAFAAQAVAH